MARIIRLSSTLLPRAPGQACYWKARWNDPWAAVPALWCDFSEWNAAPSLPMAGFRWNYGIALDPGQSAFGPRFRENNRMRFLVKVVWTIYASDGTSSERTWVGVIDIELDDQNAPLVEAIDSGDLVAFATGANYFTAFGVESLLDCQRITSSLVGQTAAVGPYWVKRGLQFNQPGIDGHVLGNRSDTELVAGGFAFYPLRDDGGRRWSTLHIVDYLLRHQTPADNSGRPQIPFVLHDPALVLPVWDEPVLPQQGRTTRELLNALISRQRARGHYFDVVSQENGPDVVRLVPFSFSENIISFEKPATGFISFNTDPIIIAAELDRGATLVTKRSAADKFDMIRVLGARRTSTATLSFADGTLDIGWPIELEELYEEGASAAADYAALDDDELKELRNADARKADKLRPVYARFILPDPFGYVVGDGLGEPDEWLAPQDDNPELPIRIAPEDRQFLPHLALRAGFDYTDQNIGLGTITAHAPGAHHYLEPIVLFRRYDWTEETPRYRHVESVGTGAESALDGWENLEVYTATVTIDHEDGSLWLKVTGNDDQHCIAKTDFTPLDEDREVGSSDYREMLVTATVALSEYCEAFWPEELPFGYDAIRVLTLDAGDDFRRDYIVPETIVQLEPKTGNLQRSTGGYLRDDRKQLSAIARLAYGWYGVTRKAVTLETTTIVNQFEIGQLVISLGDPEFPIEGDNLTEEIQSCVTSLRYENPLVMSEGNADPSLVKLTLQTAFAELDPLALGIGARK